MGPSEFTSVHDPSSLFLSPSFFKINFVVAGGGFYSYNIHQGNKLDKERKKLSFMLKKRLNTFFWMGAFPRLPSFSLRAEKKEK